MSSEVDVLKCYAEETETETIVRLCYNNEESREFAIDRTECPKSYAIFLAITDFLDEKNVKPDLVIYVDDLFVFNVLSKYLQTWIRSNWITSHGKPVAFVDILQTFAKCITTKKIRYSVKKL